MFDDPSLGSKLEALGGVGPFDDLDLDGLAHTAQSGLKHRPLVTTVGIRFEQERMETEQHRHDEATMAILEID